MPDDRTPFVARLGDFATDAAALAGAGLVTFGVAKFSLPAGYIVAGVFLIAVAWLAARRAGN